MKSLVSELSQTIPLNTPSYQSTTRQLCKPDSWTVDCHFEMFSLVAFRYALLFCASPPGILRDHDSVLRRLLLLDQHQSSQPPALGVSRRSKSSPVLNRIHQNSMGLQEYFYKCPTRIGHFPSSHHLLPPDPGRPAPNGKCSQARNRDGIPMNPNSPTYRYTDRLTHLWEGIATQESYRNRTSRRHDIRRAKHSAGSRCICLQACREAGISRRK